MAQRKKWKYNNVYKRYKKYNRIITKVNKNKSLSEQMRVVIIPEKAYKEFQRFISNKQGDMNIWRALGYTNREIRDNIAILLYNAIKFEIEQRAHAKSMNIDISDIYFFFVRILDEYSK